MEVFDEIIKWASGLPLWQQTALVKILKQDILDDDDVKTIVGLAIEEAKDPKGTAEKAGDPLAGFKYEEKDETYAKVTLKSISGTKNINALKDGVELKFGENGLTIVYGNNGTGKSGFSRVLKASCSCRDVEYVHGEAGRESADEPTATVNYLEGGIEDKLEWTQHAKPNAALKSVNIFDSRAARVYLHGENDIKYVPAGLDVFDKLAEVVGRVDEGIDDKINTIKDCAVDLQPLFEKYLETEAYELVGSLELPTTKTRIDEIKLLSEEEQERLANLRKIVPDKEANGAVKRRESMSLKYRRYGRLHNMLVKYKALFKQSKIDELLRLRTVMFEAAKVAVEAEKEKFKDSEYLPGTGGSVWRQLWQAAKQYSETVYHEHDFPNTKSDAKCLLCQRPLDEITVARFQSFYKFMSDKSQELAKTTKEAFEVCLSEYRNDEIVEDELLTEIFTELESDEYKEKGILEGLVKQAAEEYIRILTLLASTDKHAKIKISEIDFDPTKNLKKLLDQIAEEAKIIDVAKFTKILSEEKTELAGLEGRSLLASYDKKIKKEIENAERLNILNKASGTTNTLSISRRGGEMKEKYLIESLKASFNSELRAIYDRQLIVDLHKSRTSAGVTYSEIVLTAEVNGKPVNPEEIMSESEQKVISLAGYFAELSMTPHILSAIVLDDPVTSLDHLNIEKIAKRIVEEAEKRQVVIFTHNIVFATYLIDQSKRFGKEPFTQEISRMPKPGNVNEGLPWDALSTSKRIGKLRDKLQTLSSIFNAGDSEKYQEDGELFYKRLRETWEHAVEEYLFANVVKRFKRDIETSRLRDVKIIDTDYDIVFDNISKCGSFIHDNPGEEIMPVPEPTRLTEDLAKLVSWIEDIKNR